MAAWSTPQIRATFGIICFDRTNPPTSVIKAADVAFAFCPRQH
jgi:hypothetical protein